MWYNLLTLRYLDNGDRVPSCRTCVEAIAVRRDAPRDLGLFYAAVRIRASLNPTARTAQSEFDKAAPAILYAASSPWGSASFWRSIADCALRFVKARAGGLSLVPRGMHDP